MKAILKGSLMIGFLFTTSTALIAQSLISVEPDNAQQGESLGVGITGQATHFVQGGGMTIWFSQGSPTISAYGYFPVNETFMTAWFDIPGDASTGLRDLNVYNDIDGTLTLTDAFTITAAPGPVLTSINPNDAQQEQPLTVLISGQNTHFQQGSGTTNVWFYQGSPTIYAYHFWAIDDTRLLADFVIPYNASLGNWDVYVQDDIDGTLILTDGFTITPYSPRLTSIIPNGAYQGQSLSVRITGLNTNFSQGSSTIAWFSQGDTTVVSRHAYRRFPSRYTSSAYEEIVATFDIPEDTRPGLWDVHVPNKDGLLTLTDGFKIIQPGDLTCDGVVNLFDLAVVADNWLQGVWP